MSAGLSHIRLGRFDLFRVNPPLVRTVAALPVVLASPRINWNNYDCDPLTRSEYRVALDFLEANGPRSFWLITIARWACVPFALVGGYVCFLWARDLFGGTAGLFAVALWCFSPTVLGYASLISPDAHAAAMGVSACYLYWRWLRRPHWLTALLAGVTLGLAELSKLTLLAFYPTWVMLWLLYRQPKATQTRNRFSLRQAAMLAVIILTSVWVINIGYLFEGSFKRLADFRFQSMMFTGAASLVDVPAGHRNRFTDTFLRDCWCRYLKTTFRGSMPSGSILSEG